jgi:Mce-associated membrane protein
MARPRVSAPWLSAGVLAVVTIGLLLTLLLVIRPARADDNAAAASGSAAFTTSEQKAIAAAKVELVNLLSYSRKSFDADFARALEGTTGQLHQDLAAGKDDTKQKLEDGKFDLKAEVTNAAVAGSDDHGGIQILLVAKGYRVDDKGATSVAVPNRIQLTMVEKDGKWLAGDLQGIYLQ